MKPYLILDDQVQYCRSLSRALKSFGEAVAAHSVQEAQAAMAPDQKFALVDIRLDESNARDRQGLEFIRWASGRYPSIPIIAMSALEDPSLAEEAVDAGATSFLRKPIMVSKLRVLLGELLAQEPEVPDVSEPSNTSH